jgi:hypothetical protein
MPSPRIDRKEKSMARIRGRRSPAAEADSGWSDWAHPITVVTGPYRREVIGNPAEALSFMANRWTAGRNDEYQRARRLASAFLRRRETSEAVRVAFLAAVSTAYGVTGISARLDVPVEDDVDDRSEIDPVL